MVNRVFTESNKPLADLLENFVCMRFGETDEGKQYYRAAGYLLPQWYWQPILAICYPDGREINIKWRRTHEVVYNKDLLPMLRQALRLAGKGLGRKTVEENRALRDKAKEHLEMGELDEASQACAGLLKAVPRGWLREDGERMTLEADLMRRCRKLLDGDAGKDDADDIHDDLCNALNLVMARGYASALALLWKWQGVKSEAGALAEELCGKLLAVLRASVHLNRVSLGRYRFGPQLYHDIRAEVRNTLADLEGLKLQYFVRLKDGSVHAAWEGHDPVSAADHHRSCTMLSYLDVKSPDQIADLRVELHVGAHRLHALNLKKEDSAGAWWEPAKVWPLRIDTHLSSTWHSTDFTHSGKSGVVLEGTPKIGENPIHESPVYDSIKDVYRLLDGRRFTYAAHGARYRLLSLGPDSLPYIVPLAYRYGAVTTYQLLPVLAKLPHSRAAGAVLHNLGADDITVRHPAFRYVSWLEGQPYVPMDELLTYLEGDDKKLVDLTVRALGLIGKKDGFLPLIAFLRSQPEGSALARRAVWAVEQITGRNFGLDADLPLSDQGAPVKKIHSWWRRGGSDAPRAVWRAEALVEKEAAPKKLIGFVREKDKEAAAPILKKALDSKDPSVVRSALIIAKDLGLSGLGDQVFALFKTRDLKDTNLSLIRNVLRDFMTVERLERVIGLLGSAASDRRRVVYDFLFVVTGKYDFYPAAGTRFDDAQWVQQRDEWLEWLEDNREALRWSPKMGRFTGWED